MRIDRERVLQMTVVLWQIERNNDDVIRGIQLRLVDQSLVRVSTKSEMIRHLERRTPPIPDERTL